MLHIEKSASTLPSGDAGALGTASGEVGEAPEASLDSTAWALVAPS